MEFTKVTNNLEGDLGLTYVFLWDLGPRKPEAPKRPQKPDAMQKGKEGDPEYDLAKIEFREVLDQYEADLKAYGRAKDEHAKWQREMGGPVELQMFSCDAHDALARDPKRYAISSRTRGYANKPNQGLPEGVKPGKAHFENIRRIEQGDADMVAARRADPVFGEAEMRA